MNVGISQETKALVERWLQLRRGHPNLTGLTRVPEGYYLGAISEGVAFQIRRMQLVEDPMRTPDQVIRMVVEKVLST